MQREGRWGMGMRPSYWTYLATLKASWLMIDAQEAREARSARVHSRVVRCRREKVEVGWRAALFLYATVWRVPHPEFTRGRRIELSCMGKKRWK